mmetsp:Transcript_47065/g.100465  ORF Transcript_47065/g.100465 Transcript_47065/m.100465 type:complete len:308 (+) Transcript_47065:991-1914(+)
MLTLRSGEAWRRNQPVTAWPASWCATRVLSSTVRSLDFFSSPPMTLSIAAWKSSISTTSFLWRAAMSAASLHTLAISAPEKPGVRPASVGASSSMSSCVLSFFRCTWKISMRPLTSGLSTWMRRSKRPGRMSASSSVSARLVPAMTTIWPVEVKPSISTSSWLSVFSRSSLPPVAPPRPRFLPTASISSMKTMHGCIDLACAKRSRTREGPTPTNISMKSEPETERKGTFASPAVALARSVFPVPGGPTSMAPLGIFAPSSRYLAGCLRKSTSSMTSTFASASPATSAKVTPVFCSLEITCALDLPT